MGDAVEPLDLIATEQQRITSQLTGIEERLNVTTAAFDEIEARPLGSETPTGSAHEKQPRTAQAVLADNVQRAEVERSAVAEDAAQRARSTQTHGDRLIAGVADATAGRTAAELDRAVADGQLSQLDRERLAADDGIGAVDRLLGITEIGGADVAQVLRDAVSSRDFTGVRSPAQVLYGRLDDALVGQRAPTVTAYADLVPVGLPTDRHRYPANRAEAADTRRRELGVEVADAASQWAREALGPVPDDPAQRVE